MPFTTYDESTKTWYGPKTLPIYNPNVSAAQVILDQLKRNPNKIGQISDNNGIQMKNSEIRMKTIRAAQNLLKMGYAKNDVISIAASNHHHVAPIAFASFAIGAPLSPIDPVSGTVEMVHIMQSTKPKLIFCDVDNIATVREALRQLNSSAPIFTFGGKVEGAQLVDELFIDTGSDINHFVPTEIGDGTKHPLVYLCTSGSSGYPKSVILSHAACLGHMASLTEMGSEDVCFILNSIYWISGFKFLLETTVCGTTRIITTDNCRPELLLRIIEKYKVSVFYIVPHEVALILRSKALPTANISSLVKFTCGSCKAPLEMITRLNQFLPKRSLASYGMTEVAGRVAFNYPEPRTGSVGQLLNGFTIKIVDENGNRCGIGEDGEICIRTQHPFLGYYNNDGKSSPAEVDSEGFVHSGDVGHFDDDGYLFIVDRIKDILKNEGAPISPSEIEENILKHRGVLSVCVVGIPDLIWYELPAAVVVKNDDFDVTESEIADGVKNTMVNYKRLRGGVYFVKNLPMTSSGKIIRRKVKEMAVEMYNQRFRA